jgi:hypothetical protein
MKPAPTTPATRHHRPASRTLLSPVPPARRSGSGRGQRSKSPARQWMCLSSFSYGEFHSPSSKRGSSQVQWMTAHFRNPPRYIGGRLSNADISGKSAHADGFSRRSTLPCEGTKIGCSAFPLLLFVHALAFQYTTSELCLSHESGRNALCCQQTQSHF